MILQLADRLARVTSHRDREVLDSTVVEALKDLWPLWSAAIYRCCGESGDERWSNRARWMRAEGVVRSDPPWIDIDRLPRYGAHALRVDAWTTASVQASTSVADDGTTLQVAIFPLRSGRKVPCVVECASLEPLDSAAQELVVAVLRIYGNILALLDDSERDTLTGLLNRKTFDAFFLKEARPQVRGAAAVAVAPGAERRAEAGAAGVWLALIDIDHFKRVNDTFGHLMGDEVLLLLSQMMTRSFRSDDRLYRFGGEEFVVLLHCQSQIDALAALERLRVRVEAHAFAQVGQITISIGVTAIEPGDSPSSAVERADRAVYHAKSHGRNQVCSHAELIASGALAGPGATGDFELF